MMGKCTKYAATAEARKSGNALLSSFVKNSSGSARAKRTNLRNKIAEATRACGNAPEVERPRSKAARRRRALKGQTFPINDTPNTTWAPKPDENEIGEYGIPGLVSARSGVPAPKAKRQAYTGEEATKLEAAVNEWDSLPWNGYRKVHPTLGKISKNDVATCYSVQDSSSQGRAW